MYISEHLLEDLSRLVPIASISALSDHAEYLCASAEVIASLFREVGCEDVHVMEGDHAPAVIARFSAPAGAPTVCFYSHHDVQPLGSRSDWDHEPLSVTQVGDRLFGRGCADDKGGVVCHVETMRAFAGKPPVGVTIFIEGEEEVGSPNMLNFIRDHADVLDADAYVILDAGNWKVGEPAFTTTLRGVCDCVVRVSTLDHALHSGQFGGPVPDALTSLCRLLATLHDEVGDVAIEGLYSPVSYAVDYDQAQFRADAGMLEGVKELGTGSIADRLWAKPSVSVIGIDTVSVEQSSNTLLPCAVARISLRVPPGMNANDALSCLIKHLESHAPWGAHVEVERGAAGNPGQVPTDGPIVRAGMAAYEEAFGIAPVEIGQGGAIPLVGELHEAFPQAEFLVTGIADPDSRMHSPNESVSLSDLIKTVNAQVSFIERLASAAR